MIGIRNAFITAANIVVTNSAVLVTTTLISPIAANETQKLRWWFLFSVGATGGIRMQILVPAAGVIFSAGFAIYNTVTNALGVPVTSQQASAAYTSALANAGTHWAVVEAVIINGANAGNVDLQFAQNTADALSITLFRGGYLEVVKGG